VRQIEVQALKKLRGEVKTSVAQEGTYNAENRT
jgi:DNA-directed RNA polymerase sigma subunit (sigma70/sigma32)